MNKQDSASADRLPADRAHSRPEDAAFLQAIGQHLRTLRARRGVTRRDLSAKSDVSERYIAQLESGSGNISVLLLQRIARALGIGPEELVAGHGGRSVERMMLDQFV